MYNIPNYMCFGRKEYTLTGNFYSKNFTYVQVKFNKCKENCASQEEIKAFLDPLKFNVAFVNSYFDFSDYSNPIKSFIDD